MADTHLAQMFFDRAGEGGDAPAILARDPQGDYHPTSWRRAAARVEAIAAGVLTIEGLTLDPGSCVTILADTRIEWILCDFALLSLGLRTIPVYMSLLPPEVGYLHSDTRAQLAVVQDKAQLDKVRSVLSGFSFFHKDYGPEAIVVRKFVVLDPEGIEPADDWESLEDLEARGKKALDQTREERAARMAAIQRDDVATYVYTSGTTGPPKGVTQTHGNHLSLLENIDELGMFRESVKAGGVFLFLPLAHSFARLIEFGSAFYKTKVVLSSINTVAEDLQKSRPGFVPAAPRVYERIYGKIMTGVGGAPPLRQKLFYWALSVGKKTIPYSQRGRALPLSLRLPYALADRLVLSKIRARLGLDRCVFMLSGSAPLPPEVHEFFAAAGLTILEAYGLTETTPGLTCNRPELWKIGSVGPALKGVTLKLAADGEILAKGPNITRGYHHRPDADAEAFDEEGWFHTGDIGEFDEDGFLKITDRKKDLIKTSGGKYVAPQKIEGMLSTRPLVSQTVVIGDLRKYCVALVTLDQENLATWAAREGIPAEVTHPRVLEEVQRYVDEVNKELASFETIKYFRVVSEEFSVDNGLLTASFKVKRRKVAEQFKALIDEMYE